jgi:Mu-like prophage I protein
MLGWMGSPQQHKQSAALTAQPAIMFDKPREAPDEFRIFHAGRNQTDKGAFLFDDKAADLVMSTYRQRAVPLMGDYEHQTANATKNGQPAPASITEWTPEVRRDASGGPELWATQVKWTDRARAMLQAGEYRFFSPMFMFDDEKRPTWLVNIALTNNPATHGQEPLVAATAATEGDIMECESCGRLSAKMGAMADEHRAHLKGLVEEHQQKIDGLTAKLKSFEDWAAEESKEHGGDGKASATATLSAFRRDVCALAGEKTLSGAMGVLKAHKQSHEQHAALTADLAKQKTEALTAQFGTTLDAAVKDGKITPAQKDYWQVQAKDIGPEKGLAMLTGFVATLQPIVNSTSQLPAGQPPAPIGLTASQLEAAAKMHIPVEQITAGMKFYQTSLTTQGHA